jgi:hypothetical protein
MDAASVVDCSERGFVCQGFSDVDHVEVAHVPQVEPQLSAGAAAGINLEEPVADPVLKQPRAAQVAHGAVVAGVVLAG